MDTNKIKLILALEELKEAFNKVDSCWRDVDEFPDGTYFYPFSESFDDLNMKVSKWTIFFINKLKKISTDRVHLCSCDNCNILIIDENPQVGAKTYKVEDLKTAPHPMSLITNGEETFWGCPSCNTDAFLSDCVRGFLKDCDTSVVQQS